MSMVLMSILGIRAFLPNSILGQKPLIFGEVHEIGGGGGWWVVCLLCQRQAIYAKQVLLNLTSQRDLDQIGTGTIKRKFKTPKFANSESPDTYLQS